MAIFNSKLLNYQRVDRYKSKFFSIMLGLTNQPHLCLSHLRLHTWHVAWGWHKGRELTEGQHQQSHGQNALGHHPGDQLMEKCWGNAGERWFFIVILVTLW